MDYDDELRLSCERTGDPLNKRFSKARDDDKSDRLAQEFEDDMEIELDNLLMEQQSAWMDRPTEPRPSTVKPSSGSSGQGTSGVKREPTEKYDDAYFDSSDEEDNFTSSRKVKTNDELLYDPDADDQDEAWMAKQGGLKKAENSDAVLNCPSCMIVLCVDCQRHEKYHTQYRAMFTLNCTVKDKEVLRYKKKKDKKRKGRKREKIQDRRRKSRSRSKSLGRASDATDTDAEDLYHPVTCKVCDSEVGVYDSDGLVHFFNVIASHK